MLKKKTPKKKYTPNSKEKYMCARHKKFFTEELIAALQRLKDNTYGFCEETGEPIGLKRLMARPVATLSIEAQEKHERNEKIFIED